MNISEQWKDLVFWSLYELQARWFLKCISDLSPGGEVNINPNDCGGETGLREKIALILISEPLEKYQRENGYFN